MTTLLRIAVVAILTLSTAAAEASRVRDFTRIRGQGESVIHGLGLVMGLNGTGDKGNELVVARPLAELLRRYQNPIPSLEELGRSRSAALVMVTCVVPRTGAKIDEKLDIRVSVLHSATSIEGGELYTAPLTAPIEGSPVFAFGQGVISLDNPDNPTSGVVAGGARFIRDIDTTPAISDTFDLIVDQAYAGWDAVSHIAQVINDDYFLTTDPLADPITRVLDMRTIRVIVPEVERQSPAAFIAQILGTPVTPELLGVPAMIVADTRTGVIVVHGDVQISPAVITHKDLVITTTLPPPQPTPAAPIIERDRWSAISTDPSDTERARMEDLLAAFKQLDVPPNEQINILRSLHKSGKLHAKLVIDGAEA